MARLLKPADDLDGKITFRIDRERHWSLGQLLER